ncbi:MAG: GNAT family N-acetyltransferase [Micavibrio sp.]|nr:MAG: GNAT family N-acetyltransferase [Micavibrio sp.]
MSAKLVTPSEEYKDSFIEALREGFKRGVETEKTEDEIAEIENDFTGYLEKTRAQDQSGTILCPDGNTYERVPSSDYWLVLDDTFIGSISLRHRLNEFLIQFGGHIGYGVRPGFRQQGYGTLMLRLCLDEARKIVKDTRVLLTCSEDNTGSRKIIEANGGILEDKLDFDWHDGTVLRYWIEL